MLHTRNIVIVITVITSLYSCAAPKSLIHFEILQPAAITYPENVQTVGYLDRSPKTFDSFLGIVTDSLDDVDLNIVDTLYNNAIINGFEEGKGSTSIYYLDDLIYLDARKKDTINRDRKVTNDKVNEICSNFELDALITQDYYTIEFDQYRAFNYEANKMQDVTILIQNVKWTVYVPDMEKPLDKWQYKDTLYFANNINSKDKSKKQNPLKIMREGGIEVGYSFGIRNVPVWNEVSRIVYAGRNKNLKLATKYTNKGDWENAKKVWEQNLTSEDEKLTAKCAHNLAIYYELEDSIDTALRYARQAQENWAPPEIEFYLQELEIRQQNRRDLNRQMRVVY